MRDSPRLISATLNLDVHDVSGNVDVHDVPGNVDVHDVPGNLDVHDVPGFDSGESGLELSAAALMRAGLIHSPT